MESSDRARDLLERLPDNLPQLIKDDIQYSMAASYLYDGTAEGAKTAAQQFATVANNTTYPWHDWAKYLQYRALFIAVNDLVQDNRDYKLCTESTTCRSIYEQAYEGMLDLSKNATNPQIKEAATDYAHLIFMRADWNTQKAYETLLQNSLTQIDKNSFTDLIALSIKTKTGRGNEVNLWFNEVLRVRSSGNSKDRAHIVNKAFDNAYTHCQNNPKNQAWLWLAVYTIKYGDAKQQSALVKAVLNVPRQDPAFVPLRTALITHFTDLKEPNLEMQQKRSIIDDTLDALSVGGDFSTTTSLLNARANLASSLTDFIEHAFFYPKTELLARVPKIITEKGLTPYEANYIIANAVTIINTLPPSVLMKMAKMPKLPENYRPVIYANLWVRSILFNDKNLEKMVGKEAMKYNPVLTDTITNMAKSTNKDERQTLFLSALLHYPNLSPMLRLKLYETWEGDDDFWHSNSIVLRRETLDTFYNNWLWTPCDEQCITPPPSFLTPTQLTEYQAHLKLLYNLKGASSYISDSLVALANRYPRDLRYAKLLALYIKYTKYTSGGSRKAFITLKKIYPNSEWTKNTKYYY